MKDHNYGSFLKNLASPLDYSEGFYLVYVELAVTNSIVNQIISKHCKIIKELEFGYLCEAHMQAIPEIARSLSLENHAIYQMVRLVRLTKSSDDKGIK
ncbi:hypothetical protein ACHRV1_21440 [Flavobacterium aquidurense]|uniref:hypothetical protein n=1 Tax=Flavobacterium aquidurense TaxID=362413 RepID=UPI003757A381